MRIGLVVTGLGCLGALVGLLIAGQRLRAAPSGEAPIPRHFALHDHRGAAVTEATYRGKVELVYFGYTFCPDICPTELGYIARLLRALGNEGDAIVPLFITIDPERDTAQKLSEFVPLFDRRMVGLRGDAEETAATAKEFGVWYAKSRPADAPADYYQMDHTSSIMVLDQRGRQVGTIDSHQPLDRSVAFVRSIVANPPP